MKLASASIHIARIDGRHSVVVELRTDDLAVARVALAIPDRPGFGVELDRKRMAPFLWAECRWAVPARGPSAALRR